MKAKTRVKSVLMLSLLLSLFAFTVKPVLAPPPEAFLTAPTIDNPLMAPGDTFFIDILIDDVTDLWSFNFTLSYDTSVLTATSYSIYTTDPVGGNGFRNFFPTNEINDTAGYVRVGADRGPSGLITGELLGTSDGVTKIYTVDNPRIGDVSGPGGVPDGVVNRYDVTIYYNGVQQPVTVVSSVSAAIGRITLASAPVAGTVITVDYLHPGLTTTDPFNLVKINFSIDSRGITALDLQNSQILDVDTNPITTVEIDGSFDNRFHGHLEAPDYVNGALMPGDEFDIVITADKVRTPTWGVSFFLDYDTNVLTAETGIVNDTRGTTYIQLTGLSLLTVDPVPLVTITFMLDAGGWSALHFRDVTAVSIYGDALTFDATDGSVSSPRDVAVTDVKVSPTRVLPGESVTVNATVVNQGTFSETFNVTVFYNTTIIATDNVTDLSPSSQKILVFTWNTTGVPTGNYVIKAEASVVPNETDTSDNTFTDGTVTIRIPQVPVASFTYTPTSPLVGETVNFNASTSLDSDGSIISYSWDFGDGSKVSGVTATHAYATAGAYTITLNVTDDDGLSNSTTKPITVTLDSTPPATLDDYDGLWHTTDFTITLSATDDLSGVAETQYKINDGPTKKVSTDGQPLINIDDSNNKLEYWSSDKAGNEESHHVLTGIKLDKAAPTGSIKINNDDPYTKSTSVTLTLTATDATSGVAQMRFSNDNTVWTSWEPVSTSKAWTLTTGDGTKTIYVQFKDNAGLISASLQDSIVLDATKPTANAGSDRTVTVGTTVNFDASGSSDNVGITSYEWNFGDTATGTGKTTTHTYTNTGTFTVTLTVKDAAGNTATHSINVTVNPAEQPEAFPMWIVGAVIVVIGIVAVATLLLRKRK